MSAPEWEAPRELYFYDEWLQQNAKGRLLCGNNRYVLCDPTQDARVRALVEAVRHEREMVCQDMGLQLAASEAVESALRVLEQGEG